MTHGVKTFLVWLQNTTRLTPPTNNTQTTPSSCFMVHIELRVLQTLGERHLQFPKFLLRKYYLIYCPVNVYKVHDLVQYNWPMIRDPPTTTPNLLNPVPHIGYKSTSCQENGTGKVHHQSRSTTNLSNLQMPSNTLYYSRSELLRHGHNTQ